MATEPRSPSSQPFTVFDVAFLHGLPFVAVWGAYLAAFWPGILSEDSLASWRQMTTLELDAYLSPVHTLTNWLITRVWLSPAAIAGAQILALAGALCLLLWACARAGAPAWLRWASALWLTVLPATGLLVITLWKDIPYSIAHVLVAALSFPIARSRGEALKRPAVAAALIVSLVAMAIYRHNGLPVTIGYLAWLAIISRGVVRRRLLALAVIVILAIGGIHWGVTAGLRLAPIRAALAYQTPLHHVSAIVASGAPLDEPDRALLASLMPLSEWKARYVCYQMLPLIINNGINWDTLDREREAFMRTWRHLALRHPGILLRHQACVTGMIWRPDGHQVFAYTATPDWGAGLGIVNDSFSWPLRRALISFYEFTMRPKLRWALWGTAAHLWLMVACAIVVGRRRGFTWAILPFVPALLHTLVLLAVLPSPEFRLQYPVFLLGSLAPLMAWALLAGLPPVASPTPSSGTRGPAASDQ